MMKKKEAHCSFESGIHSLKTLDCCFKGGYPLLFVWEGDSHQVQFPKNERNIHFSSFKQD